MIGPVKITGSVAVQSITITSLIHFATRARGSHRYNDSCVGNPAQESLVLFYGCPVFARESLTRQSL
jgi:hypothetical protein